MQQVSLDRTIGYGRVFARWLFVAMVMAVWAASPAVAESVTFYSGEIPVTVDLALDELQVRAPQSMAKADLATLIAAQVPDAEVTKSIDPNRRVVTLDGMAKSRAALGSAIASLLAAGFEVEAVGYPFTPKERTQEIAVLINGRILAQFPDDTDVAALFAAEGLTIVEQIEFMPNTYLLQTANNNPLDAIAIANRLQETNQALWASPETARHRITNSVPDDPLFPQQWHLQNTGQEPGMDPGNDVNIVGAWDLATGKGVNITVVDDGVQEDHPDLLLNVRKDLSTDYANQDNDPTPVPYSGNNHGTAVAGMAAGRGNNGLGITGAAYEASIIGASFLSGSYQTDLMEAKCVLHLVNEPHPNNQTHINTNSWGHAAYVGLFPTPPIKLAALEKGVLEGRNGKGVVYTWSAGNDRLEYADINADGMKSSRFTIGVAATGGDGKYSYYSTPGAGLLINTPSSFVHESSYIGTTTADLVGADGYDAESDYTNTFGGTSSACPLAAGIVALMLEVNPSLTWRDVQHILVDTAEKNDPTSDSWANNGAGKHFSHDYGFGRIDAEAAVTTASSWTNVPAYATPLYNEHFGTRTEPLGLITPASTLDADLNVTSEGNFFYTEAVEVFVHIKHPNRSDLTIDLTSPSGTVSHLMTRRYYDTAADMVWMCTTFAHWGEDPNGTWRLSVTNESDSREGELRGWYIRVHGHGESTGGGSVPPVWTVSPETSFMATGTQNSVISPFSKTYTIKNSMGSPMAWSVTTTQPWLKISAPSSGTLPPSVSGTVTLQFNNAAALLDPGSYSAVVMFNNLSNGETIQRAVSLNIAAPTGTEPQVTSVTLSPAAPGVSDDLTVSYTASVDVSEYRIHWYRNGEYLSAYDDFTILPASITTSGDTWYAEVSVSNGLEWSVWVASQTVTISAAPSCPDIAAPTGLTASDGTYSDRIFVEWSEVSGATSYRIYRSALADPATATFLGNWTSTSFTDYPPLGSSGSSTDGEECAVCCSDLTNIIPGLGGNGGSLPYYYWVSAYNGCAESPRSVADTGYAGSTPSFFKKQTGMVFEPVIPSTLAGPELLAAPAGSELALRLMAATAIEVESVWGSASWEGQTSDAAVWVAGASASDGWVVLWPGEDLAPGTIVNATAGATTADGTVVGPVSFQFLVTPAETQSAGAGVVGDTTGLANSVGDAWKVGPEGVYDQPATVRVALPAGYTPETAHLHYLVTTGEAPGWYPADQVVGWMVPGSLRTETASGTTELVFEVNHSGLVRFAASGTISAASGMPLLPTSAANLAMLATAMITLLCVGRLRKTRRS